MRVLAVGDIHAKTWIIESVARLVDNYDAIIFVGDYADDWNKGPLATIESWKALRALQALYPRRIKALTGNHDYIYTHNTKTVSGGYNQITQMLLNSPDNRFLKKWLKELPVIEEIDGVTYSHAGISESWNGKLDTNSLWKDDSPIWARPTDAPYRVEYKKIPQVFGHTPSPTCWEVSDKVWCIDTFSTYPDGTPIGDETVLSITNGKTFKKIRLKK